MNSEPMSDERMEIIRKGVQALADHAAAGGNRNWAEVVVGELFTEVERLRAHPTSYEDLLADRNGWKKAWAEEREKGRWRINAISRLKGPVMLARLKGYFVDTVLSDHDVDEYVAGEVHKIIREVIGEEI